jgi:hypothetical protein
VEEDTKTRKKDPWRVDTFGRVWGEEKETRRTEDSNVVE